MNTLKYRQDVRTEEEFSKDIKSRTLNESFSVGLLKNKFNQYGYSLLAEDSGVDNSGKVILNDDELPQNVKMGLPDYTFTISKNDNKIYHGYCDIKSNKSNIFSTFKISDLVRAKNYNSLIVVTVIQNKELLKFFFLGQEAITNLINSPHQFNARCFGEKKCVQISSEAMNIMSVIHGSTCILSDKNMDMISGDFKTLTNGLASEEDFEKITRNPVPI